MKIINLPNILKLILVSTLFSSLSVHSENIKAEVADVKDVVYNSIEFPSGDKYYKEDVVHIVRKNGAVKKVKLVDFRSDGVKVRLENGVTSWIGLNQLLTKEIYEKKLADIENKKEDRIFRGLTNKDKKYLDTARRDLDYGYYTSSSRFEE